MPWVFATAVAGLADLAAVHLFKATARLDSAPLSRTPDELHTDQPSARCGPPAFAPGPTRISMQAWISMQPWSIRILPVT